MLEQMLFNMVRMLLNNSAKQSEKQDRSPQMTVQTGSPARAVGHFCEGPTISGLQDSFTAVWVHKMPKTPAPPLLIYPDGTIDLQWIEGELRIAGPDLSPQTEVLPADTTVVGFRFYPAAASAWLGTPASELVGQRLALQDLWGRQARTLAARIHSREKADGLITSLETAIMSLGSKQPADRAMRAAYQLVQAGPPQKAPLIPWLARSLAMSERTMRRRFHECFGYGPKTLSRILRYQRFLRLSATSQSSTAVLAFEAGYADQAHLIRESRRISGCTPKSQLHAVPRR
jgi:AraC-like DNA-binding protein